jgi:hypothetical protein
MSVLTGHNHVQVLHAVNSLICELPTILLQSFINLLLQTFLYIRMCGQLVTDKTQKCGCCVKTRQEEQDGLRYDVFIIQF